MIEDPTRGRTYRLVSKATGRELGGGSLAEADIVHVEPVPGELGWPWTVEAADIGLRFRTDLTLLYLAHVGVGRLDSNLERQVYAHGPNESGYQKWRPIADGEGYWQLINVATGFVLDGSDDDIYTLEPNDGAFQRWGFIPLDPLPQPTPTVVEERLRADAQSSHVRVSHR